MTKSEQRPTELYPHCPEVVNEQFHAFLGDDFNITRFIRDLRSRSLFDEARGTVQSFTSNTEVRTAQRSTYENTRFSAACEGGESEIEEIARYRMLTGLDENEHENNATIEISPGALRTLYRPLHDVLETLDPNREESQREYTALGIAYRSIYSGVLAQFMVKQHALSRKNGVIGVDETVADGIDGAYTSIFGKNKMFDRAAKLDRVAMAIGGSVIVRASVNGVSRAMGGDVHNDSVSLPIKLFVAGKREADPLEHREVSFSLAHAMSPKLAAGFMQEWFTGQKTPERPTLRLVE